MSVSHQVMLKGYHLVFMLALTLACWQAVTKHTRHSTSVWCFNWVSLARQKQKHACKRGKVVVEEGRMQGKKRKAYPGLTGIQALTWQHFECIEMTHSHSADVYFYSCLMGSNYQIYVIHVFKLDNFVSLMNR